MVFFHPKGSVPVEEMTRFRSYFEQGYDLIIASRNIKGARNEEDGHFLTEKIALTFY